jgi:hypothetical protein
MPEQRIDKQEISPAAGGLHSSRQKPDAPQSMAAAAGAAAPHARPSLRRCLPTAAGPTWRRLQRALPAAHAAQPHLPRPPGPSSRCSASQAPMVWLVWAVRMVYFHFLLWPVPAVGMERQVWQQHSALAVTHGGVEDGEAAGRRAQPVQHMAGAAARGLACWDGRKAAGCGRLGRMWPAV